MIHKMYPEGGRKLARMGIRNKLSILHGLTIEPYSFNFDCHVNNTVKYF